MLLSSLDIQIMKIMSELYEKTDGKVKAKK